MTEIPKTFVYRGRIKASRGDMQLLRAGKKKCTIRMGTASVATPEITMTDGRDSIPVKIIRVENEYTFGSLNEQHALDEGFANLPELIADLRKYYPRAKNDDRVTVIYFEPIVAERTLFDV